MRKKKQTKRDVLNEYSRHYSDLIIQGQAIDTLERSHTNTAIAVIHKLKASQQRLLTKMDRAAAKLGAPYVERGEVEG